MFKRKSIRYLALLIGALSGIIVLVSFASDFAANFWGYLWNIDEINSLFDMPIPAEATNIVYSGHQGRGGKLSLSFEAPGNIMDEFTSQFCDDALYQGYDPFHAIDTREPGPTSIFLNMEQVSYYSYSLDTSPDIYGIRCIPPRLGQLQIRVNKAVGTNYVIELEWLYCIICDAEIYTVLAPPIPLPTVTRPQD